MSAVRSSASDTASASLLATVKSACPALILAGLGMQPCGVSSMVTLLVLLEAVLPLDPLELEQPAAAADQREHRADGPRLLPGSNRPAVGAHDSELLSLAYLLSH